MDIEKTKETLKNGFGSPKSPINKKEGLSSGSTTFNLACSGDPDWAICMGKYFWFAGASSAGKSFLMMTFLAEACINPEFDEYDLVLDNVEDGVLMDLKEFFGKLDDRIEPPSIRDGKAVNSRRIEDFYFHLDDRLKAVESGRGRRFIYALDSMDALTSKYEESKFQEQKAESRGGKKAKGDYGDGKAKVNSKWARGIAQRLRDTKCILIIISQVRDKIDAIKFDSDKETIAGGRALKFYATFQVRMRIGQSIKKEINGTKRQIGIVSKMTVGKNRLTGKEWTVDVPIYWSRGFDDVGSMIDFLVAEKHWAGEKKIEAKEFEFSGPRIKLIRKIEQENLEPKLKDVVVQVWKSIEAQCVVERKNKYA